MRTATLALLLALGAPSQDEGTLRRWIVELEDDAPAVRDRAASALAVAGDAADGFLRKAASEGSDELRSRASGLLRIREQRRTIDPPVSVVTLSAAGRPVREVLAELGRQGRTPIDVEGVEDATLDRKVSVELKNVVWFRALDAVVRSHGGFRWSQAAAGHDQAGVQFEEGPPPDRPWTVDGTIAVGLTSVRTSTFPAVLPQVARESTSFHFFWAFERGARPLEGRVELAEIRDDAGGSYADRLEIPESGTPDVDHIDREPVLAMPVIPPPGVDRFAVIRGQLVVEFPTAVEELEFEKPASAAGAERRRGPHWVKLLETKTTKEGLSLTLEFRPQSLGGRTRVTLLDKAGKRIDGEAESIEEAQGEDWQRQTFVFQVAERKPARLRCTMLTGTRERRIPFEFRDVRFR